MPNATGVFTRSRCMRRLVTISSVYANKRGKRRVKNPLLRTRLLFYRKTVKMEKSVFPVRKYREENEDNRKRRREKDSR